MRGLYYKGFKTHVDYNQIVERLRGSSIYGLCILVGIVIALLGLSPRPHEASQAFQQARWAADAGDPLAASQYLAQAAAVYPSRTDLLILAGRYAQEGGDYQAAIRYLEEAASRQQLSPADLMTLGDAYLASGDTQSAMNTWGQIPPEAGPVEGLYLRMAELQREQGDYPAAVENLKLLVQLRPNDAQLYYQLGLLLTVIQPEASLAYLSQATAIDPALAGRSQELVRRINTSRLFNEPAYTYLNIGQLLASMGEWELAVTAFEQAIRLRPDYAEAWAYLGEARQHPDEAFTDPQTGLSELEQAIELDPNSITANVFMGFFWQRQADFEQALKYLSKASELDPENPVLLIEVGNTIAANGDLPAAQAYFQEAISLAPEEPSSWRQLAEFCLQRQIQVREIALPAARQAVILAPDDPRSLDVMGQTLLLLEDTLTAERFLRRAIQADPYLASAHLHLGILYLDQGKTQLGQEQLQLAETLAPNSAIPNLVERLSAYYFP